MVDKFECIKCGNCCRDFLGSSKVPFEPPCFNGDNLIAYSVPGLQIQPWEKNLFPKECLVPYLLFFDLTNNQSIILSYTLSVNSCPNLDSKGLCSIYEKRPIACRTYPCLYMDSEEAKNKQHSAHGLCSAELPLEELNKQLGMVRINETQFKMNTYDTRMNLYKRYGIGFVYNFMLKSYRNLCIDLFTKWVQENQIHLAKNGYDMKYLVTRINNNDKIDIDELIRKYTKQNFSGEIFSDGSIQRCVRMFEDSLKEK